jgi:hypothetical protein
MNKQEVKYVLWLPQNRPGEFEFLCHTQMNWTTSLKKIKKELEEQIESTRLSSVHLVDESPEYPDGEKPLTREEAIEEMGGMPKIFKLTIEEIK